jgi:hypothetical protein
MVPVDINTILLAIITGIVTLGGLYIGRQQSLIHTAVNSERTASTNEIARLNAEQKRQNDLIMLLTVQLAASTGSSVLGEMAQKVSGAAPQPSLVGPEAQLLAQAKATASG